MNQIVTKYEVLTLAEAARFLRVKKALLQELVKEGRVPARKVGAEWRFFRGALQAWLSGSANPESALLQQAGLFKNDPNLMQLLDDIYQSRGRPEREEL